MAFGPSAHSNYKASMIEFQQQGCLTCGSNLGSPLRSADFQPGETGGSVSHLAVDLLLYALESMLLTLL